MREAIAAAGLAACVASATTGFAATVEPAYRFQLLGGQYFYAGEKGSLSGNASASVTPAVEINERLALIPTVSSSYQGTKQVLDLVGAGSMFQEQMDHRASLRAVVGDPDEGWRIKPNVSYKYQLLKETRDESWTKGLFDYWRLSGGVEAEYPYRRSYSVRVAADYYYTGFPNYASLESQAGVDLEGRPLSRELAGRKVLDHHAQSFMLWANAPAGRSSVEAQWLVQRTAYGDQRLVDEAGSFGGPTREDVLNSLQLGLRKPFEVNPDLRVLGAVDLGFAYNASNQNSYDARRAVFLRRYYNYSELRSGAGARLLFGDAREPIALTLAANWWFRRYPYRPPQDSAGGYRSGSLEQHAWLASVGVSYPLAPRMSVVFNVQYGGAESTQKYEQSYAYNYTVANYLFGISYDY